MATFFLAFGLFLALMVVMAIGYLIKRKVITGSCGGISLLGMEKVCDCDDPCDRRKEMLARQARRDADRIL